MSVELIDHMGDDLRVVQAARISYNVERQEMQAGDVGLLKYLLRNHHASPFEHVVFTFRIQTSLKVAHEWERHRTDAFNERSSRYSKMDMAFQTPTPRRQVGKQGNYRFEVMEDDDKREIEALFGAAWNSSEWYYNKLLEKGAAREVASFVLPQGTLTSFYWTVKLRHALHFLSLRNAENTLREFREEAKQVETEIAELCPVSYQAWCDVGRPQLDSDYD